MSGTNIPERYRLANIGWTEVGGAPSEAVTYDLNPRGITFWSDCIHVGWFWAFVLIETRANAQYGIIPMKSEGEECEMSEDSKNTTLVIAEDGFVPEMAAYFRKEGAYDLETPAPMPGYNQGQSVPIEKSFLSNLGKTGW